MLHLLRVMNLAQCTSTVITRIQLIMKIGVYHLINTYNFPHGDLHQAGHPMMYNPETITDDMKNEIQSAMLAWNDEIWVEDFPIGNETYTKGDATTQ